MPFGGGAGAPGVGGSVLPPRVSSWAEKNEVNLDDFPVLGLEDSFASAAGLPMSSVAPPP